MEGPAASQTGLRIGSVVINCNDFEGTVAVWQEALRYVRPPRSGSGFAILKDPAGIAPNLSVQGTPELKFGKTASSRPASLNAASRPVQPKPLATPCVVRS